MQKQPTDLDGHGLSAHKASVKASKFRNIRVPIKLAVALKIEAARRHTTLTELVTQWLEESLSGNF